MSLDKNLLKLMFLTGTLSLIQFPNTKLSNSDISKFFKNIDKRQKPTIESIDLLIKTDKQVKDYLPYTLRPISEFEPLIGNLIGALPETKILLQGSDVNLEPSKIKSIFGNILTFDKSLLAYNSTKMHDWLKIESDKNNNPIIYTSRTNIRNGPFEIYIENDGLFVRSNYGNWDVIPGKVILQKKSINIDSLEIVKEPFYPVHYVSSRLKSKEKIEGLDLLEIIGSYHNLKGDYFDYNHKNLVCIDIATLPIKTLGFDYKKMIEDAKIPGNEYKQRKISVFRTLLDKLNYSKHTHYFMNKNLNELEKFGTYENITAKNFGINELTPGQIIMFTRIYNSGPFKGKIQKLDVHFAIISEVNNNLITKAAMISSTSTKPPYTEHMMLQTEIDFKKWYEYRQDYRGSDETSESLKYRITGIIDFVSVINEMKKDFKE